MTLAEKLLSLRTNQELSQEDLAEKMGVSRQSVSKWETGQSVPDLDKIIKLADLFGVSVDELVREGESPQPPEPKVVYVERERKEALSPIQKLGIVMEVSGAALAIIGLMGAPLLIWAAAALVILGLPLLLSKKHPFLIDGWLILAASWYLCPRMGLTPSRLRLGLEWIYYYFTAQGPGRESVLLGGVIVVVQRVLLLALLFFTARPFLRARRQTSTQKQKDL